MASVRQVADSLEVDLRDRFLAVIEVVAQAIPDETLQVWLDNRDFVAILDAFEEVIGNSVTFAAATSLTDTYESLVRGGMKVASSLELSSQLVVDRIRADAAKLVVGVGQDTVLSLRTILEGNYLEGLGARAAGRVIRSVVGLLPQHAQAVANYSTLLDAQKVPEDYRSHQVATYANRLLNYRAENIARTETISAANAGQLQAWIAMADRGALQRHRTRVVWVVTEDDRLCPWCAPMDGATVELGGMFTSTHKGFPEGKPETQGPGSKRLARSLRPDPRSQPRDPRGRFTTIKKKDQRDELDGRLVPLPRPIVVAHPPLHPQCRCDLKLTFLT